MLLGNYFHNINKNYKNFSFSGISFDTKGIKKNNIFGTQFHPEKSHKNGQQLIKNFIDW